MDKLYRVRVFSGQQCVAVFTATKEKARLRAHIHHLQGLATSRLAYVPAMTKSVADMVRRGQVVAPSLRN